MSAWPVTEDQALHATVGVPVPELARLLAGALDPSPWGPFWEEGEMAYRLSRQRTSLNSARKAIEMLLLLQSDGRLSALLQSAVWPNANDLSPELEVKVAEACADLLAKASV